MLVDKLLRECQSDGIDKVFERTGVLSRDAKPIDLDERTQLTSQTFECPGCFEEYSIDDMAGMTCKHFYCKDCFSNYLKIQITESGASTLDAIPCPGHKCKFLVDAVTLASIIDYTLYKRYVGFVAKAYVEANPDIHWCPSSRGCEYAAQINPNSAARTVQCQCGYVYCFKCRQEAHWPASCLEMEWWLKTHPEYRGMDPNEEEARSMQWILQHTQDCPKCFNPIEKNGGCNHLVRYCGILFLKNSFSDLTSIQ
jgi:ariadne-1